jgi:pyridoxal biosynthesis lyase PdxS
MQAVTIPVMAKCRIGHFVEAQILETLGIDYIDESEVTARFPTFFSPPPLPFFSLTSILSH